MVINNTDNMRHSWYGFLWSLFNVSSQQLVHYKHVVLQTPTFQMEMVHQTLPNVFPKDKMIRFTNDMSSIKTDKDMVNVPLISVFRARDRWFPQFHMFLQPSHYLQFSKSQYANAMEYSDFCEMEDKLAHIVSMYLEDVRNRWLIVMEDPLLTQNIRSYCTKSSIMDHTIWITTTPDMFGFHDMVILDLDNSVHPHI